MGELPLKEKKLEGMTPQEALEVLISICTNENVSLNFSTHNILKHAIVLARGQYDETKKDK